MAAAATPEAATAVVVTAGAEVMAAGVVGIEMQTLAPVDLFRRRLFRFIPV
jgi:hypothetical protein